MAAGCSTRIPPFSISEPMRRPDGRKADELRKITVERGFHPHALASVLFSLGNTRVACSVSLEEEVPPFLAGSGQGWITAEYGMLPCATHTRSPREAARGRSGRTLEIQRLIGRSLRAMVDLESLPEITLRVDCDVLNADGSTRCAGITGGALALAEALARLADQGIVRQGLEITPVAAVSVGVVAGEVLLDLCYQEDSSAQVDANLVLTRDGKVVEVQASAEAGPFPWEVLDRLLERGRQGAQALFAWWPR